MTLATLCDWWRFAPRPTGWVDIARLSGIGLAAWLLVLSARAIWHYYDYQHLARRVLQTRRLMGLPIVLVSSVQVCGVGLVVYVLLDQIGRLGTSLTWRLPLSFAVLFSADVTAWLIVRQLRLMRHALQTQAMSGLTP